MKSKLIFIAAAVIFIITVILLFYLHSTSEKEVVQRFQAEQLVASRQLAREIESHLHDRAQGVNILSSFPSLQNRDMKKMTADIQTFFDYVKKDHVKAVSVYDEKGTIIYSTTKEANGRNYKQLDFFQWATKKENKGKQFVSSLIRKTDDTTTSLPYFRFLIATPIYKEVKNTRDQKPTLKFVGIVTSTIDLEEVVSHFLPFVSAYAHKEHAYILDRNGTVLFHSEHPEMALINIRLQDKTCLKCHVTFEHVETILNERQGTTEYALKEKPKELASFSSIEFKNISWKIVICISYEEVSGFINRNMYMTFILIGIITLTLIGGSSLIYRSNRLKIRAQEEAKQWMEKQKLEDGIRESEEHYRSVVDVSPDAIVIHCEGKIVFVNPAAVKLVGASSQNDLLGKPAIEFVHPDEKESIGKRILEILKSGKSSQWLEERFIKMDGCTIYVETIGTPTTFNGKPSVQVIIHDITERKRAEEALHESEKRYHSLFENMLEGFAYCKILYDHDNPADFIYIDVNNAFEKLTGLKNVVGKKVSEVIPGIKESNPELFEIYGRVALTGKPERFEIYLESLGIWLSIAVYSPGKEYFIAVFDNITERKQAENRIKKINRIYAVLSNINKAIVRVHDINRLFNDICRVAIEDGKFLMAWIGMVNTDSKKVEVVASAGFTSDYLAKINIDLNDEKRSQGPTGRTIISGSHFISNNIEHDESMIPWREDALKLGYRSSASFPIKVFGKVSGVFNMYSSEVGFFDKDEIKLLDELAMDISFALEFIEREAQRKRAEEALQESEEGFRRLFEESTDPILLLNQKYFFNCNPAALSILQLKSKDEIGNKTPWDLSPEFQPDGKLSSEKAVEMISTAKQNGYHRFEWVHTKKDGTNFFVEVMLTPIALHGEEIFHVIWRDITERKRAEEALVKSEEKHRRLVENLGKEYFFYRHDTDGVFSYVSPSVTEMLGYSEQEFLTHHTKYQTDNSINKEAVRHTELSIKGQQQTPYEVEVYHKDGSIRWLEVTELPLRDDNGKVNAVEGIAKDITERKLAEEELHRKEEHHKAVIENIFKFVPEGVLVLTESLNLLKHNKAFDDIVQKYAPLLGYTEEGLAEKITEQLRSKIVTRDAAEIRIMKKNLIQDRNTNKE